MSRAIEAVVCIPTFRRPDWLARTIGSVLAQKTDFGFAVVVVDNDAGGQEGASRARAMFADAGIETRVVVESAQGNCHAINRAFGTALSEFPEARHFLMIDDDEMALPGWLQAMVDTALREKADIVGGPVIRQFDVPVPESLAQHQLFVSIEGETRALDQIHGSGNCLISRHVFEAMPKPPFDVRYNFLGGGDMDFFTRCKQAGFTTWWCAEAVVYEFVAAERVTAKFLMQRSIRTGSINYVVDRTHLSAPAAWGKNGVSLMLGAGRSLGLLLKGGSVVSASHPLLVSVGRVVAGLGFLPQPYKAGAKSKPPRG